MDLVYRSNKYTMTEVCPNFVYPVSVGQQNIYNKSCTLVLYSATTPPSPSQRGKGLWLQYDIPFDPVMYPSSM